MKAFLYGKNIGGPCCGRLLFLVTELARRGVSLYCNPELAGILTVAGYPLQDCTVVPSPDALPPDLDLMLALGGDGTFLSSLTWVRDRGIPVAGIHFGHLGFLTTAQVRPEDNAWIGDLVEGRYRIDDRFLLHFEASLPTDPVYPYALNEVSLQRLRPQMMEIRLRIDEASLPPYRADGLLISTSTGSTAYSLSLGGPILMPGTGAVILTPVAPHNLNVRPLIVPNTSSIAVSVVSGGGEVTLTADNRSVPFPEGSELRVTRAPFPLRRVSLSGDEFISALQEKLFWGVDPRNGTGGYHR